MRKFGEITLQQNDILTLWNSVQGGTVSFLWDDHTRWVIEPFSFKTSNFEIKNTSSF